MYRNVLDDLLADLKSGFAGREDIDINRALIKHGKLSTVLEKRAKGSEEVMALQIVNPSVEAIYACALVLEEVPFD